MLYLEDFYGERVRVPEDRHYDPERELWLLERDGRVVLGMTHAGVVLSGGIEDLVLEAEVGQDVAVGGQLLSVEAYKAAQDITSPLAGRLAAVNRDVLDDPELLDEDPYGAGWLLEVEPESVSIAELAGFPTASDYLRGLESSCAATDEGGVTGGPDLGTAAGARVESAAGASREVGPCGETKRALVAHCSDPVALTRLASGMKVINLGARVWDDAVLSSARVGAEGCVLGIVSTESMLERYRLAATDAGLENVDFRLGEIERIPGEDGWADMVIANCAVNLSARKGRAFAEVFRVLAGGGLLALSDVVVLKPLPASLSRDPAARSGLLAGAFSLDKYLALIERAGFMRPKVEQLVEYSSEQLQDFVGADSRSLDVEGEAAKEDLAQLEGSLAGAHILALKVHCNC